VLDFESDHLEEVPYDIPSDMHRLEIVEAAPREARTF
jgi:hypothetical protein